MENIDEVKDRRVSNYLILVIALLIVFGGLLVFLWLKADEVTKDPCLICAKKMGEKVICTTGLSIPVSRTYFPNGTIVQINPQIQEDVKGEQDKFAFNLKKIDVNNLSTP